MAVRNTRQKGRRWELEVLREVYYPVDEHAVTVGGSARSDYASDIMTAVSVGGMRLIPECKNNKSNGFLADFKQACEQAEKEQGLPVLHKKLHGTSDSVVILKQSDFAAILRELKVLSEMLTKELV